LGQNGPETNISTTMTTKIEEFLETLLERFRNETHEKSFIQYDGRPNDGDGEQSLEYLAVRSFKGRSDWYKEWLLGSHPQMGSHTPLILLYHDPECRAVRQGILDKWLADKRLIVPGPPLPTVVWSQNGCFSKCTLVYADGRTY
jgi:hypothetical protein